MTKRLSTCLMVLALVFACGIAMPPAAAQLLEPFGSGAPFAAKQVMMTAGQRVAAIRSLKRVSAVGVVRLDRLRAPNLEERLLQLGELRITAARYSGGIGKLRAALRANPVTRKALASRGIPIQRVVGVRIGSNGSLRLYLL